MNWEDIYRRKVVDAGAAMSCVESGNSIYVGGGAGAPSVLVDALCGRAAELRDVQLIHILTFIDAPYVDPKYEGSFRSNSLFIGHNVRKAVQEGRADFTPIFLSEIPGLFQKKILPIDVAIVALSPPDEHGFCSFGVEVGTTKPAAESARHIIAEVNQQMPRTLGDSFIHVSRLSQVVEVDHPLPLAVQGGNTPENMRIGHHIAGMIPDGATLQMGIGGLPDAVLQNLTNHKDLGIHTELFSDGVVSLFEQGIITCSRKTFHPGKMVAGFLFGTEQLYRFVDNNAIVELHPTDYVNDPFNIALNDNMVAINAALQVDLTGQVCADSIGPVFYSGVGGQLDFIRGAARSKGGLPIIALPSTAKNDTISRISLMLPEGSGVTTTRNDVHFIVTEYGVAELYGKTIRQRAQALINIAHPKFRDELAFAAKKIGYL
ncbi:4-hydroxybutyrate coenzyme A transferase [Candidatus Promineifilum breve]|uniref:4-hydroxybutyrate coenzyme A transferase n=1 Tax=Candidatus Promineifilum breve TaxID=1806508 RepID=A0A160SY41_9CHLR|nr:acetyl-CoA hydrolase/transferase C-terminal domain-containing protein [Candidatus Promineifilum breve]CUS02341.2 4-hydroxybutyrate coenzyme A transferase [Candidatus Promineifilum breve]